jgi:3-oxoacyl-[acyl-carrier protein] reductase
MRSNDLNAFITGGSRGIGRDIVLKFAASGYHCAFTYAGNEKAADETVRLASEINSSLRIKSYKLNLMDKAGIETVVEEVLTEFEDIHIVVNNAAIVRDNAAALMADDEWDDVIHTNLSGPFYVIRSFLMHFISNRYGRIINISSLSMDGSSGQVNYAASKAGLVGLSNTIAREYGSKNITSNIVVVGYVPTELTEKHFAEKLKEVWMEYCPMRRTGTGAEIAEAVHFLTTEKAGFITGETIRVSGGLTYAP